MNRNNAPAFGSLLLAAGALVAAGSPSPAQFQYLPPAGYGYGAGYGYSSGGIGTRTGNSLNGMANLTSATGEYYNQVQQARVTREKSRQESITTRRKMIEERQWELANTPTSLDLLDKERAAQLRVARTDPPLTEILAGTSLNTLLKNSRRLQTLGVYGPRVPLDQDSLKQINVTTEGTAGNTGLLKEAKLDWPRVLYKKQYADGRKKCSDLYAKAVEQAGKYGKVEGDVMEELTEARNKLESQLGDDAGDLTPTEFIQGNRFLRELKGTFRSLEDPNVGKFLSGKWSAQGKTAAELIDYMGKEGLVFAPAARGADAAYRSIYTSLSAYDIALEGMANRKVSTKGDKE
jgi:hypothetical protein